MLRHFLMTAVFICGGAGALAADDALRETFENAPSDRWDYVADTVMGGVSTGRVDFERENGVAFARLTGTVSTQNNGGFIQFRHKLSGPPAAEAKGVRIVVRGNGEQYFVHLRTQGTVLPWQYYQAGFATTSGWTEVRLPFAAFTASGRMLRSTPLAGSLTSVGVVAFGRDHMASVDVKEIGFF